MFEEKPNDEKAVCQMKLRKPDEFLWICLFLLSSSFYPLSARAEDGAIINESDDHAEIVFSYTRDKTPKEDVAANIEVITQEEMKKIPATNAAEVLQYVPGVYIDFMGGRGSQAAASIQGSDVRQVSVYQDGVPLNLLGNPMTDLSRISLSSIDRIEVYKGAASSSWGSALGGVINIITKEPDLSKPFTGEIRSSYGQFDTSSNSALVSGGIDRLGYLVTLSHDQSDGFRSHTNFQQDSVYAKLNYLIGESSRISFVQSYNDGKRESPSLLLLGLPCFEDAQERRSYSRLLFDTSLADNLTWSIEGRSYQTDIFDHYSPPQPLPIGWGWDYYEQRWGVSSRLRHEIPGVNNLVAGFDGDWGQYEFSSWPGEFDAGNWAAYINDTFTINAFSIIGGIRYDNNLDFGSEVSPMGGLIYHFPVMEALLRLQVSRGFSAPPGAWLHAPVLAGGNPDLKAETGVNYQVGSEIKPLKFLKLELNLFQSDINNLITVDPITLQAENIAEATRRGIEGRIGSVFNPGPDSALSLSFGASFIDVRDGETDKIIEDIPRTLLDLSVSYRYKNITNSIVGRYVFNNSSTPETHDKVFVFDYLLNVKLPSLCEAYTPSLFFAAHDFTDADYLNKFYLPQPGPWVNAVELRKNTKHND